MFHVQTYEYDDISDIIIYRIVSKGAVIPSQYPLYKQCDPRWGNNTIVRRDCIRAVMIATASAKAHVLPIPTLWSFTVAVLLWLGQETTTVCAVGCLMSSISMAIAQKNIQISGQTSDPGTLNAFLRTHNGYGGGLGWLVLSRRSVVPGQFRGEW